MKWHITVISRDGVLLFAGAAEDWVEAKAVATVARAMRPSAKIWLRDSRGQVQEWV